MFSFCTLCTSLYAINCKFQLNKNWCKTAVFRYPPHNKTAVLRYPPHNKTAVFRYLPHNKTAVFKYLPHNKPVQRYRVISFVLLTFLLLYLHFNSIFIKLYLGFMSLTAGLYWWKCASELVVPVRYGIEQLYLWLRPLKLCKIFCWSENC